MSHDLAVIGGGLMGLSTAVEATRAGMRVVVLEAERIGRHASGASAGGVRSLNRHPAEIPLARAALSVWRELPSRIGADGGFRASGQIRVALDAEGMAGLEARAALSHGLGYDHEQLIDEAALVAREPALEGRVVGGLIVEDDGFADPLASLKAYRAAALRAGVDLREGVRVEGIEATGAGFGLATTAGPVAARRVVNAAGAWGPAMAAQVCDTTPVMPRALQMTVTERLPRFAYATIGVQGRKLSLKQGAEGTVVIGGAFEAPIGADGIGRPEPGSVAANLANAAALFPALRHARVVRTWSGIEGFSPDGLPVLGPSPSTPGLIHAFGFSAHGFALAPLIGIIVAEMLEGRETNLPLAPFDPARFAAAVSG